MDGSTPNAKRDDLSLRSLPSGWRRLLVAGLVCLLAAICFLSYRWYTRPTTLTIAVGSQDGEAARMVSAIASRFAQVGAPVRLSLKETTGALQAAAAFSSEEVDLAVVRGDASDLSKAQAVAVVTHAVLLLVAPPGSPLDNAAALKRISIGAIGKEINRNIIAILAREYNWERSNVTVRDLPPSDVRRALRAKEIALILVVIPTTEKYISLLRGLFPQNAKAAPVLLPIETAGAIAERERAYESFELPKGTLRSSPAVPSDDLSTLRVTFYLVAKKELDDDVVFALTEALTNARRDLLGEWPMLAQISAPDLEPDAYLPVHPGAANFYNGTQTSLLDKWGNVIFLVPMVIGGLASIAAAARRFLREEKVERGDPLDRLYALAGQIRTVTHAQELDEIEEEIDRVLRSQRLAAARGEDEALVTSLNVAAHRLETLISDRRAMLADRNGLGASA